MVGASSAEGRESAKGRKRENDRLPKTVGNERDGDLPFGVSHFRVFSRENAVKSRSFSVNTPGSLSGYLTEAARRACNGSRPSSVDSSATRSWEAISGEMGSCGSITTLPLRSRPPRSRPIEGRVLWAQPSVVRLPFLLFSCLTACGQSVYCTTSLVQGTRALPDRFRRRQEGWQIFEKATDL